MRHEDRQQVTINRFVFRTRSFRWIFRKAWYSTARWGITGSNNLERLWLLDVGMFTIGFAGIRTRVCHKCGSLMARGKSYLNGLQAFEDFGGESLLKTPPRGCTVSRTGQAKMVDVDKCTGCGRSVTI